MRSDEAKHQHRVIPVAKLRAVRLRMLGARLGTSVCGRVTASSQSTATPSKCRRRRRRPSVGTVSRRRDGRCVTRSTPARLSDRQSVKLASFLVRQPPVMSPP